MSESGRSTQVPISCVPHWLLMNLRFLQLKQMQWFSGACLLYETKIGLHLGLHGSKYNSEAAYSTDNPHFSWFPPLRHLKQTPRSSARLATVSQRWEVSLAVAWHFRPNPAKNRANMVMPWETVVSLHTVGRTTRCHKRIPGFCGKSCWFREGLSDQRVWYRNGPHFLQDSLCMKRGIDG